MTSLIAACALSVLGFLTTRTFTTSAIAFLISLYRLISTSEGGKNTISTGKLAISTNESDRNFDFAFPSLAACRQIGTISGNVLINASSTQIPEVPLNCVFMYVAVVAIRLLPGAR